ncbi:hypothetical protein BCR34DRAFT_102523 [Clohesyomyces aquaticus]|uniref:Uncharacterized protein n=1 Tax=Clohesyomyces aquaticus TaxID=1231657 RepID=A0A1Y1YSE3_9PLEO|nr:hypothetical protein BCR34DRAFT_102523 [Clohesyomyces aquaticus]
MRMKTLEFVYNNITMVWKGNALTTSYGGYFETVVSPRIDLLLRTILETLQVKVLEKKPSYTRWISTSHLLAEGFERNQISFTPSLPEQSPSVGEVLREVMQNRDSAWSDIVHAAISHVSVDAFIALFLGSCTNLKSITLGFSLVKNNSFIARICSYPPMGACFD